MHWISTLSTVTVHSALYQYTFHCAGALCPVPVHPALYQFTLHCTSSLCTTPVHPSLYLFNKTFIHCPPPHPHTQTHLFTVPPSPTNTFNHCASPPPLLRQHAEAGRHQGGEEGGGRGGRDGHHQRVQVALTSQHLLSLRHFLQI